MSKRLIKEKELLSGFVSTMPKYSDYFNPHKKEITQVKNNFKNSHQKNKLSNVEVKKEFKKYDQDITLKFIENTKSNFLKAGYPISKWIYFCEEILKLGIKGYVHYSQSTKSRYIYLELDNNTLFKIRFSDHKPNKYKEKINDCDLYIGVTNRKGAINTEKGLEIVKNVFKIK